MLQQFQADGPDGIFDTRRLVHVNTIGAFGDALIGPRLRLSGSADEAGARDAFVDWFSGLIELYIGKAAGL